MAIIGSRALGLHKKIDIYVRGTKANPLGRYLCSTNSSPNLKDARERYALKSQSYAASDLKAVYAGR